MKKGLKLLLVSAPIVVTSAIALKFKPPKKEAFNFVKPLKKEGQEMLKKEKQKSEFKKNQKLKEEVQNKIQKIEQQIEKLSALSSQFPSTPDPFERNILKDYYTHLRIALDCVSGAIDFAQLFMDSPIKMETSNKEDEVLNSITINIEEFSSYLTIFDYVYPPKMQYSMDEISSELREALNFTEKAIEVAELLVSDSTAEGPFNYWETQAGKATNVIVKAGDLNERRQREYVNPNILIKSPSEPDYADQKLGQSSGEAILSNRLQIEDIPQEYRNRDVYSLSFRYARGRSVERYIEICHLLLEDIQSLTEKSAMNKKEGKSLLSNSIINGYDYFEDKEALDNFIIEQEEALGSTIGLFRDPNYSAEEFNKNVNNHSKDVIDLVYSAKENLKTLSYIGRIIRGFQKRNLDFAIISNSKHFKRPQKAYEYLVEHADEWRGAPEVSDIVITDMSVGIFFERR